MPIKKLKESILEHHASIHAFCKAHPELSRASVYLLLSGKYPGKWNRQADRIRAALSPAAPGEQQKTPSPPVSMKLMAESLQRVRCGNCRRLNRRECMACRDQTAKEASQLFSTIYGEAILEVNEQE